MSFFNIISQLFFAVIFRSAVSSVYSECIFNSIFGYCQILADIGNFFIADLLDCGILGGFDCKTSAVKKIISLSFRVSFFVDKVLNYIVNKSIYKVGVRL